MKTLCLLVLCLAACNAFVVPARALKNPNVEWKGFQALRRHGLTRVNMDDIAITTIPVASFLAGGAIFYIGGQLGEISESLKALHTKLDTMNTKLDTMNTKLDSGHDFSNRSNCQ
jgi:hypothetical protein